MVLEILLGAFITTCVIYVMMWMIWVFLNAVQKQDPTIDQFELASEFVLIRDGKTIMKDSFNNVTAYLLKLKHRVIYKPQVRDCKGNIVRNEEVINYTLTKIGQDLRGDNPFIKYILIKYVNKKEISRSVLLFKPV